MSNKKETQKKLQALEASYFKHLPDKVREIDKQWQNIQLAFDKKRFEDFYTAVHALFGTTITYGYLSLSNSFRDLEIYLKQLLNHRDLSAIQKSEISHLVERIKDAAIPPSKILPGSMESFYKARASKMLIYLAYGDDPTQIELRDSLDHLGYKLNLLKTLDEFQAVVDKEFPAAILVDEEYLDDPRMSELVVFQKKYQIPFLSIAQHDDLPTRLKAIRVGATIFFRKPINVFHVTKKIEQLCGLSAKDLYRVLILDDSQSLADYYALVLREAGMSVRTITEPAFLMHEMSDFGPNVLLMDLYLPGYSGFELATMIRQEERYASLPIIFVSTEDDRFKQLEILNSCGGDDFLTKPVLPQNLISAVKSRAQRSALVLSYLIQDNLTHLLNHNNILKQLEVEILRVERTQQKLTIAMLDLDNFKQVNDTFGHPMGDIVLKKVAELLSAQLRKIDFVGRYGGDEFIIIFPNTEIVSALKICKRICSSLSSHVFEAEGKRFYVTLSSGVAEYSQFQMVDSLVATADSLLYKAKSSGRNRVEF